MDQPSESNVLPNLFRDLVEAMPQMVWVARRDGRFDYLNRHWHEFTGKTIEECTNGGWLDAVHPDDRERTRRRWEEALRNKSTYEVEYRLRSRHGQYRWFLARARPVTDEASGVIRWLGTCTDIDSQRRAYEDHQRDAMLLANVHDSVIVTDLSGIVTFWNEGATQLFGWEPEEMLGKPLARRMPPEYRELTGQWIARIAAGEEFKGEWEDFRKDGSRVWISAHTAPLRDANGKPVAIMGVSHDITPQKQASMQITQARDSAEAANRAKDQFLAVLSHELRTPLTPVVMAVAAMENDAGLPERLREDVSMIRRNVELETRLIDDLLDLNRVATGKLRLELQPAHIRPILEHVVQSARAEAGAKRLTLRCELESESDLVRGDPVRLQQVFWNLLRNAIKFTPAEGTITLACRAPQSGRLTVEVRDTGIGIAPQLLEGIFDAFNQGDAQTTRQFGGLGLGLAIAKAIVHMHGGAIRAASDGPGTGATFTVELPTIAASETADDEPESELPRHVTGDGLHVLLVEDHPDTSRILAKLLSHSGFVVKTADSAASAMNLAASEPFDVVVSDIGLPDASGYELMRQIREAHGLSGIALSGYGMDEDVRRSREAGFAEHVVKPVDIAQLRLVIARVARRGAGAEAGADA